MGSRWKNFFFTIPAMLAQFEHLLQMNNKFQIRFNSLHSGPAAPDPDQYQLHKM
jgi:hypothetical protein